MPQTRMTDTGRPPAPTVADAWTQEDIVSLLRVLDAAYRSEQQVSEVQS